MFPELAHYIEKTVEREVERQLQVKRAATGETALVEPMSRAEAAAFCRVSTDTIRSWEGRGLKRHGRGRTAVYYRHELVEFLASEKTKDAPQTDDEWAASRLRVAKR